MLPVAAGRSALHLATSRGHVNCCQALLNRGATHLLQDSVYRWTPVHIAGLRLSC